MAPTSVPDWSAFFRGRSQFGQLGVTIASHLDEKDRNTMTTIRSGAAVTFPKDLQWFDTMPGEQMAIRIDSRHLSGAVTVVEARVPVNGGPPAHYHKNRDETFEILEGTFRFRVGEEEFDAPKGTSVVVPRGIHHTWANIGATQGRILLIFTPGGIDEFFAEIGRTRPEGWQELSERYDTWIYGPPLMMGAP
jgi:mannose-6-phosphate isomerase-like protein (cupin superfamily)